MAWHRPGDKPLSEPMIVSLLMHTCVTRPQWVNSLRPSDAIWRQWSWTTLAQVMACCLTAPSHYLNQCWLIIRGVLWHTSESSFAGIAQGIESGYEFEKDILKNIFKSPRGQWVKKAKNPLTMTTWDCFQRDLQILHTIIFKNCTVTEVTSKKSRNNVTSRPIANRNETMKSH